MKRAMWFALGLGALQVADLATTAWVVSRGGHETNPIVLFLGWPLAAALKFGVASLVILGANRYSDKFTSVLGFVAVLYMAVIANNLIQGAT